MEIIIGIIAIGVVILWVARNRQPESAKATQLSRTGVLKMTDTSKFHAVSIKFSSAACEAAKALDGRRILSNQSPTIPLPECDVADCDCRFVHYQDRRDRRDSYRNSAGGGSGKFKDDKRHRLSDRRSGDPEPEDYFS
jgi:hypothetical protein